MGGYQNDPGLTQQEAGFGFNGRFWTESINDGMVAKAGGTQANSTPIDSMFCRFSTVASVGDGALLPPAFGGPSSGALIICVVNDAANAMQVFAQGTDTINGAVGATGVTQMGKSVVYYQNTQAGKWVGQGLGSGYASGASAAFPTYSSQDNITAQAAGTQNNSTLITGTQARISTVVTAADGVLLPPAMRGMEITIVNDAAANAANVFPASQAQGGVSGGDRINPPAAQNAPFSLVVGTPTIFYCFTQGVWRTK